MENNCTTVRKEGEIHFEFLQKTKADCVPRIIGIGIGMEGIGIMEGMGIVGIIGLGLCKSSVVSTFRHFDIYRWEWWERWE